MKKILLVLSVFASGIAVQAQSNFQKAISIPFMTSPTPKSIVQCSDGGYLLGSSSGVWSTGASCLIKTDASGQVTWTKSIGSSSGYMNLIQAGECIGGGYYIFGDNTDSSWMSSGFSLTKLDASGNIVWGKVFPNSSPGYGYSKVRTTNDGGFLLSESLYSKMGALKLDGNGNVLWHTAFSDSQNDQSPKCPSFDCFIGSDGSMVFSGKRNSDILLVKSDMNGQMLWSSTIGNNTSYYHANTISNTADGGYVVAGYDDYYPFVMKVSNTGTVTWYHAYNTPYGGEFVQVRELTNGNFIALGDDYMGTSFVTTLSSNGTVINSNSFGNSSGATFSNPAMCSTADGGFAITGTYYNPGNGLSAITLMKTDANGAFVCNFDNFPMSFLSSQISPSVLSVPIYSFTQATNSSTISPNTTGLTVTEVDFCLLFSTNDPIGTAASITAFPSPIAAGENLHLNVSGVEGTSTISIYDANGRIVKTMNQNLSMSTSNIEIPTMDFASGIYLVRMTGADENVLGTTRFIVR